MHGNLHADAFHVDAAGLPVPPPLTRPRPARPVPARPGSTQQAYGSGPAGRIRGRSGAAESVCVVADSDVRRRRRRPAVPPGRRLVIAGRDRAGRRLVVGGGGR